MEKIIIFDFDGVLADSVQSIFRMNQEAAEVIDRTLTMEQYLSGFEEQINVRLATLLDLTDEEKERFIARKAELFPKYYTAEHVRLFSFAEELLAGAAALGEVWIASSTPTSRIEALLQEYDLLTLVTHINGNNRQQKHIFFDTALNDRDEGSVFFITDTTGDLKEAQKTKKHMHTIAVTWGFHTEDMLSAENPDCLVTEPGEIIAYIQSQ